MSAEPPAGGRRLVLLRHGRTAYNHARRIQGQVDIPLDETGHKQAAAAAAFVAPHFAPGLLWCSDLSRARQTASYVAQATGLTAVEDARLREYHLGEREGMDAGEYAAAHPEEYARFKVGDFDVVPGGERAEQVAKRMCAALDDLLAETPAGSTSVAVSHGAAIRVAAAAMVGLPTGSHHSLHGLDNCAWVVLEEGSTDPVLPRGLRLRAYNRTVSEAVAPVPVDAASGG
ncbi:MAG: histidine phosphatase family protein [Nocardioides sp.]|nr:histidine phosphatase family protein [Nocardioides sp.]